jgi:hypothetical protein
MHSFLNYETNKEKRMHSFLNYETNEEKQRHSPSTINALPLLIGLTGLPYRAQDVEERGGHEEARADKAAGRRDQASAEARPSQGHVLTRYRCSFQVLRPFACTALPHSHTVSFTASPGTAFPLIDPMGTASSYSLARHSLTLDHCHVMPKQRASLDYSNYRHILTLHPLLLTSSDGLAKYRITFQPPWKQLPFTALS